MSENKDLIYETKRLIFARYPRFGSEIANANIQYRTDLKYHTAATDGKNIYIDPNYLAELSEDDRLFLIAHEILHIKFMHAFRLMDKDGKKRNFELWNTATDAIINANLERDGFRIKEGYVNRPEALKYSAEEFYEILLKEQEEQKKANEQKSDKSQEQNGNSQENQSQDGQSQDSQSQDEQSPNNNNDKSDNSSQDNDKQKNQSQGEQADSEKDKKYGESGQSSRHVDDHSLWEEAFEKRQEEEKRKSAKQKSKENDDSQSKSQSSEESGETQTSDIEFGFDEREEFEENRREKRAGFRRNRERTEREIRGESTDGQQIELGNIGESKEQIDWKLLLRREVEKSETIWSQRRSIAENNYAYRLEENDIEDEAETEIMIDVSGSVDLDLVKAFLREVKPLLKQSKLRVGCFNEKFWGLVDIKSVKDIDNFTIPARARGDSAWTEDWDLAVRSFTQKREINKIVFTDGYPCPGTMPKDDLKRENVIWLVYGNEKFNPCCGRVININEKQLSQLHQSYIPQDELDR